MAGKKKKSVEKKASVKKTAKETAVKKKNQKTGVEDKLTDEEVERFKEILFAKRREIVGDVNCIEDETLKKSRLDATGDLSSMPIHMADIGTDNYEQEFALDLLDSERKMLEKINEALVRVAENRYGICEGTGEVISRARLEAKPWARYSIEYAKKAEQGFAEEGENVFEESEKVEGG